MLSLICSHVTYLHHSSRWIRRHVTMKKESISVAVWMKGGQSCWEWMEMRQICWEWMNFTTYGQSLSTLGWWWMYGRARHIWWTMLALPFTTIPLKVWTPPLSVPPLTSINRFFGILYSEAGRRKPSLWESSVLWWIAIQSLQAPEEDCQ